MNAGFVAEQRQVKAPAQEIQFLALKWQDECLQIPVEVMDKITALALPMSDKETQAFLGAAQLMGSGNPRTPRWRTVTAVRINSQPTPNLAGTHCSSWMHQSPWGPMAFIPAYTESGLVSRDLSPLFFNDLGDLERSQLAGSWQTSRNLTGTSPT